MFNVVNSLQYIKGRLKEDLCEDPKIWKKIKKWLSKNNEKLIKECFLSENTPPPILFRSLKEHIDWICTCVEKRTLLSLELKIEVPVSNDKLYSYYKEVFEIMRMNMTVAPDLSPDAAIKLRWFFNYLVSKYN